VHLPKDNAIKDHQGILDALNRFVSDLEGAGDLERLEDSLRDFNLFVALGAVNTEIKHSNFLAWLLDPNENHGFGDIIVKRLLQRSMLDVNRSGPVTPVDLDLMDLSDLEIRREWSEIDVLLISQMNRLVVVIENKIGASESDGQLAKYRRRVCADFAREDGWRHIFIFLTIDGDEASDESYTTLSYTAFVDLLESTLRNRADSLSSEISMAIRHYVQMMRRYHMEDSELISLARRIYAKHRPALDFIFEHRPDAWSEMRDRLVNQLRQDSRLIVDVSTEKRVLIRFRPKSWSKWDSYLSQGTGWVAQGSNQMLLCEVKPDTKRERARIQLVLGPGPKEMRDAIFSAVQSEGLYKQGYYPLWTSLLIKSWRSLQNESGTTPEQRAQSLWSDIDGFLANDCPRIEKALSEAFSKTFT
jgi:PD-(D/E)XK nuclease superfamily